MDYNNRRKMIIVYFICNVKKDELATKLVKLINENFSSLTSESFSPD